MDSSDIKFYLKRFWVRFPLFFLLALVPAVAGIATAMLLPPMYKSSATVLVEGAQIPNDLAASTVQIAAQEQVQVVEKRLMTRDNLLEIAQKYDLYGDDPNLSPSDVVNNIRESTSFDQISLSASRTGEGTIAFTIGFTAAVPKISSDVTSEYVERILKLNQQIRQDAAQDTLAFFNQESERLIRELSGLEAEIVRFKLDNEDSLPDSLDFRREQLAALQEQLATITREEIELSQLRFQLEQAKSDPEIAKSLAPQDTPLQRELDDLRRLYTQQRAIYSETHPIVTSLRSRIEALEEMISEIPDDSAEQRMAAQTPIELRLSQTTERLDLIREQKANLEERIGELDGTIKETPRVEMALNILERKYGNLKLQFDRNSQALAEAEQGEKLELRQKGQRFSVIEQAVVPTAPVSPNRPLIAAGGVAAGLGLGGAVVLLLELLNRTIHRPVDVTRKLGIELMAALPYIDAEGEVVRRRTGRAAVVLAILAAIPAAIYLIDRFVMPLGDLAAVLASKLPSLGF